MPGSQAAVIGRDSATRSIVASALLLACLAAGGCRKPEPAPTPRAAEPVEAPSPDEADPPPDKAEPVEAPSPDEADPPPDKAEPVEAPPPAQAEPVEAGDAHSGQAEPPPDKAEPVEAEPDKGPRGIARFKLSEESETAGPVDFKHRKHQKQFGCKKCHHEIEADTRPSGCGTCHGPDPEICDLQTSFHKTCNPCHNSMGMGPVKCMECHKWIKKKEGKEQ
jgi:hypothetical protein